MMQIDEIKSLRNKIQHGELKPETEEATKQWFILPMFNILGYNIYSENVVSEYSADFGNKKGERVDYYLKRKDNTSMIVECKAANVKLNNIHVRQLAIYYHNLSAKNEKPEVAILTNGIEYQFFKEAKSNVLSDSPFLTIDLLNDSDSHIEQILKFGYKANDKIIRQSLVEANDYEELSNAIDSFNEYCNSNEHINYQQNEIIRQISHWTEVLEEAYYLGNLDKEAFIKAKKIIIAYVDTLFMLEYINEKDVKYKNFSMYADSTKFNIGEDSIINGLISDNKVSINPNEIIKIAEQIKSTHNRENSKDEYIVKSIQSLDRTIENMEDDLKWMIPDFAPIEYLNRHTKLVQKTVIEAFRNIVSIETKIIENEKYS